MADIPKTFSVRCSDEKLASPTTAEAAKQLLIDGFADTRADGKLLRGQPLLERAAALVWGRAHFKDAMQLASLGAGERATINALYSGGKRAVGGSELDRIVRWFKLQATPVPSPAKPDGPPAPADKDKDAADQALEAAAARARAVDRGSGRKSRAAAKPSDRVDGGLSLRRRDPDAGSEIEVSSDDAASPQPKRKRSGGSGSGAKKQRTAARAPADDPEEIDFQFRTRKQLASVVPKARLNALDLTRDMTTLQRIAQAKAEKQGTDVDPVLAHQVNFLDAFGAPDGYDKAGRLLADAGKWAVAEFAGGQSHAVRTLERAARLHDQATWRALDSSADSEIPASSLLSAHQLVRGFFDLRRDEVAEELEGLGPEADEVIAGTALQARQVKILFELVAARLAASAPSAAAESGLTVGRVINSGWRRILTPFMQHHIMLFTSAEVGDLVGTGAKKGLRQLDFSGGGAGAGAGTDTPAPPVAKPTPPAARPAAGRPQPQTPAGPPRLQQAAPSAQAPPQAAPAPGQRHGGTPMNIGIPESYAIVGSLGVRKDSETCRKCRRQGHLGFECPKRLAELFGEACPG